MTELLDLRLAQQKILSAIKSPGYELCFVENANGRVLAEEITSPRDLPPFTNSSMDGFAIHSDDVSKATTISPVRLPVTMDIPAGFFPGSPLSVGSAARILTGAPIPQGADSVVPVENTDLSDKTQTESLPAYVTIYAPVQNGDNVRSRGEDVQKGQLILKTCRVLQPQDVGLLISLGIRQVKVLKKPRIALFSSGDELLTPDQPLTEGKIYDANRYVLTTLLEKAGAEVIQLGIASDSRKSVTDTLEQALIDAPDLIVSSAGVSVGAFDYVRMVIEENGKLDFWRVNMRPGKPVAFGSYKGIPFLGLPGNPVSAYIGCLVFVLPILRYLQGQAPYIPKNIKTVLKEPLKSPDGRESFYRGKVTKNENVYEACLTGHQGSGNLFSLVQANALLIVPAGVKLLQMGEEVTAWPLDAEIE